jgi:hypothetical protein
MHEFPSISLASGFIYSANDPRRPAGAAIPAARIS